MFETSFVDILETEGDLRHRIRLWRNDPAIRRMSHSADPISTEEHRAWLESLAAGGEKRVFVFFLDRAATGVFTVDFLGLRQCRAGGYLYPPSLQGRGLGVVAEAALYAYVFDHFDIQTAYSEVYVQNRSALNVIKKLGGVEDAYLEKYARRDGQWWDLVKMRLERAAFQSDAANPA